MFSNFKYDTYDDLLLQLPDEEAARRYLAYVRWGGNPKCQHCGHQGPCYYNTSRKTFYCRNSNCRKQFSVTVGTIFERTHLPLMKWFKAMFEIANGSISSVRLARKLNVNQRTAWKMEQKIRQALKDDLDNTILSHIVEADTSLFSPDLDRDFRRKWNVRKEQRLIEKNNDNTKREKKNKESRERRRRKKLGLPSPPTGRPKGVKDSKPRRKKGEKPKNNYYKYEKWVLGMAERGGKIYLQVVGRHATDLNAEEIARIMSEHIEEGTRVITDGGGEFEKVSIYFPDHDVVVHDPWVEYTRKDGTKGQRQVKRFVEEDKYTNTMESTWAHLKRVQWGNHIQISYGHANRYLYEFAFQRNNRKLTDAEKFQIMLHGALLSSFPYNKFQSYSRVYQLCENGEMRGKQVALDKAA